MRQAGEGEGMEMTEDASKRQLQRPSNDRVGSRLISVAFKLYDCDLLNGRDADVSIAQRVQLVINQYERHKGELYDQCEYVI
jgi:hypothetical protein